MVDPPPIDGRRREAFADRFDAVAPVYTTAFDPTTAGAGTALTDIVAELFEDVSERLDRVPEKHRAAFVETLGFDQRPAHPARLPLAVTVATEIDRTITIDGGTAAVAPGAGGGPEQTFTIPDAEAFEATPARIESVYSVDPTVDRVCDHWQAGDPAGVAGDGQQLFVDRNRQAHRLYLGDSDGLTVEPETEGGARTIRVAIETSTDPERLTDLDWQLHGEAPDEAFHDVTVHRAGSDDDRVVLDLVTTIAPTETTVGGVKSLWLRARVPDEVPIETIEDLRVGPQIELGPGPTYSPAEGGDSPPPREKEMRPNRLLADDVELPIAGADGDDTTGPGDAGLFHPLGTAPRRESVFYVAADEPLSKPGVSLEWTFHGLHLQNDPAHDDTDENDDPIPFVEGLTDDDETDRYDWVRDERQPRLAWEYYDGDGWSRISELTDKTDDLIGSNAEDANETVSFPVPEDLATTTVAGHEHRWVRARLVGGSYGTWTATERDGGWNTTQVTFPPVFDRLTVKYRPPEDAGEESASDPADAALAPPRQVRTENHLAVGSNRADATAAIQPFQTLPEAEQTLYLGFDRPLSGGPITLFADVEDRARPRTFRPSLEWEYSVDPTGTEWERCQRRDGTAGLTERGIVRLVLPGETVAAERFGEQAHWLRARVTEEQFQTGRPTGRVGPDAIEQSIHTVDRTARVSTWELDTRREATIRRAQPSLNVDETHLAEGFFTDGGATRRACGRDLPTDPPAGDPTERPPTLTTLAPNAAWAENVRPIANARLGASDGDPDQTFAVEPTPILEETVWVDEAGTLATDDRRALVESDDHAVRIERDDDSITAVWVAWQAVENLLDSGPTDRHYVVDRTGGAVRFGDGTHGKIPPAGADTCRIDYRTGGGPAGNVEADTIGGLKQSIQFVDGVSNPAPGTGGAATESVDAVADRASRELRDRDRAVAAADYERIAADASRRLARVSCLPDLDRSGDHGPGWVTLVIVPDDDRPKPVPKTGLIEQVRSAVADRAPATLVAQDRLVVRGPSYVGVDLAVTVVAASVGAAADLDTRIEDRLDAFLHPLTGRDGDGWPFGALPDRSELYARLEAIDGVAYVDRLRVRFSGDDQQVTVREGERTPSVGPDTLIHADRIDVDATMPGGAD